MYRTTAEAVAGTKVYAGGKWLQCIGNKSVRVGERIWADGKCVYGYFQEAQQPLVVPERKEPIIFPVLLHKNQYDFDERKIVFYDATKQTFRNIEISDVPVGDYFLVNGNTSIFLLKSAIDTTVIDSWQGYDRYEESGGGETTFPLSGYIDASIKDGTLYSLFVQDGVVQVRANKNVVKEINLRPFLDEVITKCAHPPDAFYPHTANYDATFAAISVHPNSIEDENSWAFTIDCYCVKSCSISYSFPEGVEAYAIAPIEGTDGYTTAEEEFSVRISSVGGVEYSPPSFLLDDGYHYSKEPFVIPSDDESRVLADVTFFSPSGAQIFSGIFNYNLYVLSLRRVHNGYLLGVDSGTNLTGMFASNSTPYPLPKPYLLSGLFLLQGGECSVLSDWGLCKNVHFNPLSNINLALLKPVTVLNE